MASFMECYGFQYPSFERRGAREAKAIFVSFSTLSSRAVLVARLLIKELSLHRKTISVPLEFAG